MASAVRAITFSCLGGGLGADGADDLEAVEARHVKVEQEQLEAAGPGQGQSLLTVPGPLD